MHEEVRGSYRLFHSLNAFEKYFGVVFVKPYFEHVRKLISRIVLKTVTVKSRQV